MKSGFCTLWGRPNAGKSTLLNALLGRKHVITSPRPQTTRHRIAGVLHGDEFQIVFLDTPGIHAPQHKLGETLVKNARAALADTECVIFVADGTDAPHDDDVLAVEGLKHTRVQFFWRSTNPTSPTCPPCAPNLKRCARLTRRS
jgi:GTP-binding protein Era